MGRLEYCRCRFWLKSNKKYVKSRFQFSLYVLAAVNFVHDSQILGTVSCVLGSFITCLRRLRRLVINWFTSVRFWCKVNRVAVLGRTKAFRFHPYRAVACLRFWEWLFSWIDARKPIACTHVEEVQLLYFSCSMFRLVRPFSGTAVVKYRQEIPSVTWVNVT